MTPLAEARDRATRFLAETHHFAALGLEELAADARMLARILIELADELESARSACASIAEQRDRALDVLAERAYSGISE